MVGRRLMHARSFVAGVCALMAVSCASGPDTTDASPATTMPAAEPVTFSLTLGGEGRDRGIDLTRLGDGGYAVIGYTSSAPAQGEDVYLARLDELGQVQWVTTYGGSGLDNGWAVVETADGGLTMVGSTDSLGAGGTDMYLIHTDRDGKVLSEHTYGGPENEFGWALAPTADGGFVLAGQTESFGTGDIDGYVVSVGPDDAERWSVTVGGTGEDRLYSIVATDDGGFALVGTTTTLSSGSRDAYLVKLDATGALTWERRFGAEQDDVGHSVRVRGDHGLLVTGYTRSFGAASYDAWVISTTSEGDPIWETRYGGPSDDRTISGEATADGGVIATGYTKSFGAIGWDVFLVRLDDGGEVLWHRRIGGGGSDTGYTVIPTDDGGYAVAGETTSAGIGGEVYVIKFDPDGEFDR